MCVCLHPEESKEYFNLPKLENARTSERFRFAGGILMKVCSITKQNFRIYTAHECNQKETDIE